MSQIRDLRSALRENLKTIPGYSVSRYARSNPNPPGFHLWPSEIPRYRKTFGEPTVALAEVHFTVQAFVSFVNEEGAQDIMDELLGSGIVPAAVESDRTLGGLAQDLECASSTGYGRTATSDNRPLLTSDWLVTVLL